MEKAPVFVAIDTNSISTAKKLINTVAPHVAGIKLGLEFFIEYGKMTVSRIQEDLKNEAPHLKIFLDLKLHDIPNTVAKAIHSLEGLSIDYLTIHTSGGIKMLAAAQVATEETKGPALLGVTVLTSLNKQDLEAQHLSTTPGYQVLTLAGLAMTAGIKGVIASANEAQTIKKKYPTLEIITPGIRPHWAASDDQQRITTPKEAISLGADYLVIGRPITAAKDPVTAIQRINEELSS